MDKENNFKPTGNTFLKKKNKFQKRCWDNELWKFTAIIVHSYTVNL